MVIKKLKERIKSLSGKMDKDKIKQDFEEIETINIELDHRVRSRGSDFDIPVVYSLIIALLRNKITNDIRNGVGSSGGGGGDAVPHGKKLNMTPTPLIERIIISTPMKNHMLIDHEYVNCPLRFDDRNLLNVKEKRSITRDVGEWLYRPRFHPGITGLYLLKKKDGAALVRIIMGSILRLKLTPNGRDLLRIRRRLRMFWGLLCYYRRFVRVSSRLALPSYPAEEERIQRSSKDDGDLWLLCRNLKTDKHTDSVLNDDGVVGLKIGYDQPKCTDLNRLLVERHEAKMWQRLLSKCKTCQQVKIEHQGEWFVTAVEIPCLEMGCDFHGFRYWFAYYQKRHDAIWVVCIDRLTKVLLIVYPFGRLRNYKLAEIFNRKSYRAACTRLLLCLTEIRIYVSFLERDTEKPWGTRLKFSTSFHPQT
ncbi:hypothetical protein Tco_0995986 [Tanacetum coccineum]